jgi:hypothetical protein
MAGSPFEDPDVESQHGASEFEIWLVNDGALAARVWSAEIGEGALDQATLADGSFLGEAFSLESWEHHAIRVRYADTDECQAWSEWSEPLFFRNDDGSAYLFDPATIHEVHLTIPDESWGPIDQQATPPGCVPFERDYFRGSMSFDGETFEENVGIRSKGGCGSARHLDSKTAFKIDLEWDDPSIPGCPEDRRLYGQTKVTLNNMVQDPSYSRERIGYSFYRGMGVSTPRVAYVRLHVNGEYWGLYLHQESISRRFLDRWYSDNDGVLYEGIYGCDLYSDQVPADGPTSGDECYDRKFDPDVCDDPDYQPSIEHSELLALTSAIDALPEGEFYPAIEQFVDFEQFMNVWAIDGILNNWDGFPASANNYRIYRNPDTGLWSVIPTGIDQNFQELDQSDLFSYGTRLSALCLAEADCAEAFVQVLDSRLALFGLFAFEQDLEAIRNLIEGLVAGDPRAESPPDQFTAQQAQLVGWIEQRPAQIEQYKAQAGF